MWLYKGLASEALALSYISTWLIKDGNYQELLQLQKTKVP